MINGSLSLRLTEAQCGELTDSIMPGRGASFDRPFGPGETSRGSPVTNPKEIQPPVILVADDDPDIVALVSRRLTRAGYSVITAYDGEEALLAAQQFLPQLVVLDVMMPKLTGPDVIGLLSEGPATVHIRSILTSASFGHSGSAWFPPGADGYISKPFGAREVAERVRAVLARRQAAPCRTPA